MRIKFRIRYGAYYVRGTVSGASAIELRNKVAAMVDKGKIPLLARRALKRKFDEQLQEHGIEVVK